MFVVSEVQGSAEEATTGVQFQRNDELVASAIGQNLPAVVAWMETYMTAEQVHSFESYLFPPLTDEALLKSLIIERNAKQVRGEFDTEALDSRIEGLRQKLSKGG